MDGEQWRGDMTAAADALNDSAVVLLSAPPAAPWESEAEKKTALARSVAPGWQLWLDTDERVECERGPDAARAWLDANLVEPAVVGLVNLRWAECMHSPEAQHGPTCEGFLLPRLVRWSEGMSFRGPRDFDVDRAGELIAWPGMRPREVSTAPVEVPADVLRIRHDRHLRGRERHDRNGLYCRRRDASMRGGKK